MNRIIDLITAIAFVLTLAACQTNSTTDTNAARQSNDKMNSVLDSGGSTPRGSGAIGGETGSAAVRQAP